MRFGSMIQRKIVILTTKSGRAGTCSAKPYKVAGCVKEFTINGSGKYCHMLILKTKGKAYLLGWNNIHGRRGKYFSFD